MWSHTPYFWVGVAAALITSGLALLSWPNRSVPGIAAFRVAVLVCVPWELGSALLAISARPAGKIFWYEFQTVFMMFTVVSALWFALKFTDQRRWLVGRTKFLLAIPPLLYALFLCGEHTRHWVFTGFVVRGLVYPQRGVVGLAALVYALLISFLTLSVFIRLFFRSPLHRVSASFCIFGQVSAPAAFLLQDSQLLPWPLVDFSLVGLVAAHLAYFLALFRFRLFHLIPIARDTLVDQMREGMLVLDPDRHIVDLNPATQRMLGVVAARVRGRDAFAVLPALRGLRESILAGQSAEVEIALAEGGVARSYAARVSVLKDQAERVFGHLILLYETTDQQRAQREMVEQQRALAMLHERDLLARELHDSLGQLLGYVKLQAEALRERLRRGQQADVDARLAELAAVAQDAHADVREYIMSARTGLALEAGFFSALATYIQRFSESSGVRTRLEIHPELSHHTFEPTTAAQLLRIVQEALTNVRKHARAAQATVRLRRQDGCAEVLVEDDGAGFDTAQIDPSGGRSFGLRFMQERAEEVGGSLLVSSTPGAGSRLTIRVPLKEPL